ncbi:MAG: hypothetical protein Q9207_002515, partial [Kuettlingeria erythrocarpa]
MASECIMLKSRFRFPTRTFQRLQLCILRSLATSGATAPFSSYNCLPSEPQTSATNARDKSIPFGPNLADLVESPGHRLDQFFLACAYLLHVFNGKVLYQAWLAVSKSPAERRGQQMTGNLASILLCLYPTGDDPQDMLSSLQPLGTRFTLASPIDPTPSTSALDLQVAYESSLLFGGGYNPFRCGSAIRAHVLHRGNSSSAALLFPGLWRQPANASANPTGSDEDPPTGY